VTPDEILAERGMPVSVEAERSILGAILLDNQAYYDADVINCNDFALDSHMRIFAAIARLMEDGHAVDIVTLAEDLHERREVQSIGGVAYLASLTEGLPRRLSIDEYVRIVRNAALRRRIITECSLTITKAVERDLEPDELIADQDKRLLEVSSGCSNDSISLADICTRQLPILMEESKSKKPLHCIATGLDDLDARLGGGWLKGELAIVAARTSQGKSSLLTQTLVKCGLAGIPAHCFQLEMDEQQTYYRMLAALTGIHFSKFRYPNLLTPVDKRRIADAQDAMLRFPVKFEFPRSLNAGQLVARTRIAKRRQGVEFVGLDYLQKLEFSPRDKPEHRYIVIGDAARSLASLAKDEHIAVLAISSLTEKSGRNADTPPSMADIRQSGDVAYEAGSVILLHSQKERSDDKEIAWITCMDIAKQRQGETGKFDVHYLHTLQFASTEPKPKPNPQTSMFQSAAD
jgi:replicative DNA helicase